MAKIRTLAQPFIKKGIALGLGANEVFRTLQAELGSAYRRSDFLADFRSLSGDAEKFKGLRNIRRDARPTDKSFKPIKPTWNELYEYRVRVTGVDTFSGDSIIKYTSYRSNDRLTRDELLERIRSRFSEGVSKGSHDMEVTEALPVEGFSNARLLG